MEKSTNGGDDASRLDRIEQIIEALASNQVELQQDVKVLIQGQVALGNQMREGFSKLTLRMDQLAAAQTRTEETLRHTDQRMDALILTVDEIVRGKKKP